MCIYMYAQLKVSFFRYTWCIIHFIPESAFWATSIICHKDDQWLMLGTKRTVDVPNKDDSGCQIGSSMAVMKRMVDISYEVVG